MRVRPMQIDMMAAGAKIGTLKVKLKREREFRFRIWLMGVLVRLAGWVAPVPFAVTQDEEEGDVAP